MAQQHDDEDDTPDEIVNAMQQDLLSRLPNKGKPVIYVHGRPHPDPGYPEDEEGAP